MACTNNSKPHLLNLPAEIRNSIYAYALGDRKIHAFKDPRHPERGMRFRICVSGAEDKAVDKDQAFALSVNESWKIDHHKCQYSDAAPADKSEIDDTPGARYIAQGKNANAKTKRRIKLGLPPPEDADLSRFHTDYKPKGVSRFDRAGLRRHGKKILFESNVKESDLFKSNVVEEFALLATCRQVRAEARSIAYSSNVFLVDAHLDGVSDLASVLPPQQRDLITDLSLCMISDESWAVRGSDLRCFQALKRLSIHVENTSTNWVLEELLKMCEGAPRLGSVKISVDRLSNSSNVEAGAEKLRKALIGAA